MASSDYFTITDFETFRGITPSATTTPNEDQVQSYIDLAVIRFEEEVGIYYSQTGVTEYLFPTTKGFYTNNVPVTSITSIEQSNGDLITPTWSTIESTDYRIYKSETGNVWLRNPILQREYKIVYDSGYSYLNMPKNVKYVIYLMTMNFVFQNHLFETNYGDTTSIVDVDVYKEITKGGNPFNGFSAMDKVISDAKASVKGALKTYLKW